MSRGVLMVFSGPSGCGKGTVLKEFFASGGDAFLSVSATTRAPRPGEEDGVHYYFLSREDFEQKLSRDEILEHACYCGNYYGTPRGPVYERLERGENLQCTALPGLYPCGEGAGYAGGIVSAAVDGLRCARALMETGGPQE